MENRKTTKADPGKPFLIHSKILNETICLSEIPTDRYVCYSQKEIDLLKQIEKSMGSEYYAAWLKQVHLVKKTFPGATIEDVKMEAPTEPLDMGNQSQAGKPGVEGAEATPEPPKQKSLWEL